MINCGKSIFDTPTSSRFILMNEDEARQLFHKTKRDKRSFAFYPDFQSHGIKKDFFRILT